MADKSAKAGRNKAKCGTYRTQQRQETNKLIGMLRHAKGVFTTGIIHTKEMPKDWREAFARINAVLPNTLIKRACSHQHVALQ